MLRKRLTLDRQPRRRSPNPRITDSLAPIPQTTYLSNGSILSLCEKASPDVSIVIGIPYGLCNHRHMAHLLEHMLFLSPTDKGQDPILVFEKLGAHFRAYTDREAMFFTLRTPRQYADLSIRMLSEILNDTKVPSRKFTLEKEVICGECVMEKALVKYDTRRQQERDLFAGHSLWLPTETLKQTREITRTQLAEAKERYIGARNLCLAIVGSDISRLRPKALELLIGLRHTGNKKPRFPLHSIERRSTKLHLLNSGAEQHIAAIVPGYGNPDYYAIEMIAQALGGLTSDYYVRSRLFRNLRMKRGLLYESDTNIQPYPGVAVLNFDADGILPQNESEARERMLEEIAMFSDRPMGEQEFKAVRTSLIDAVKREQDKESGLETAARLVTTIMNDTELDAQDYEREMRKLTPNCVYRIAQKYLAPGRFSIVTVTTKN